MKIKLSRQFETEVECHESTNSGMAVRAVREMTAVAIQDDRMDRAYPCNCCGTKTAEMGWNDQFLGNPLRRCVGCGHVQLAVVPSPDAVGAYYRETYSRQRAVYVDHAYTRIMRKRAAAQLAFIATFFPLTGAKVCDVGCGYGYLIDSLRGYTEGAWGVEYDPATVESCLSQGLRVEQLNSEADLQNLPFSDLVTLSHCLEHFAAPGTTLTALGRRSRAVFVEVPAYDADLHEQFVDQLGHMNFFNAQSLDLFLDRHGFETVAADAFGPSLEFFYSKRWELVRRIRRRIAGDYFMNKYGTKKRGGLWLRALVRLKKVP